MIPPLCRLMLDGRERGNCSKAWRSTDFVIDISAGAFCASTRSSSTLACPAMCAFDSSRLGTPQCRAVRAASGAALLQEWHSHNCHPTFASGTMCSQCLSRLAGTSCLAGSTCATHLPCSRRKGIRPQDPDGPCLCCDLQMDSSEVRKVCLVMWQCSRGNLILKSLDFTSSGTCTY